MIQKAPHHRRRPRNRYSHQMALRRKRFRFFLICVAAVAVIAAIIGASTSAFKKDAKSASGEPVPTPKPAPLFPLASEQNDLLQIAVDAQGTDAKVCYLTFDDGPTTAVTTKILEALSQYDVKATFFMLGKSIEANPEIAKQVFDQGHLLANHSYSHDYKELYATAESFMGEIERTQGLIQGVTGKEPFKLIRFPGGSHSNGDHGKEKQEYKGLLKEKGYYFADWNALSGDAESSSRSPAQLLEKIKSTATQKNIVVLMHDAAAKKTTAEALPSIIEYLKGQGYEFRRLDQVKYYRTADEDKPVSMIL